MSRRVRFVTVLVAGALGVGAAAFAAAGDDNLKACAVKKSGELRAATSKGKCGPGEFAITISGDAFKKSRGGTLTINGVAFKKGNRGGTLTINGTEFKGSRGGTLTINGVAVKANEPGPIGPTGPPGIEGRIGPTGPPGIPYGPPPVEIVAPAPAQSGQTVDLASVTFNGDGTAHRLLITGGFDAICSPCTGRLTPSLMLQTGTVQLLARKIAPLGDGESAGANVSEILVLPAQCGQCTITLRLAVPAAGAGGAASTVTATTRRLGFVDLGPATS